jgi:hypothetical protein
MLRVLLPVLASFGLAAAEVAVVPFDGAGRTGAFAATADGRITVGGEGIALQDIDRLRFTGEPAALAAPLGLWLCDGSWLPISGIAAAAADDRILVKGPLGDLDLPLSAVRGWGQALPAAREGDMVVLESGAYPAHIRGIAAGQLAFDGDLGDVSVPLAEVRAVRLAGSDRPARGLALTLVPDPTRPPLRLLPGPVPRLAAAPEATLAAWPVGLDLRVEGGRRVYLGGLAPAQVKEEGAFGVVWPHVVDANLDHDPLLLGGERFAHGVSLHSQCALSWQLDGGFVRFRSRVGIADEVRPEGDCPVTLLGDGQVLWKAERITGRDKAQSIDVAVTGVRQLEIRIAFGERYDIGDRVAFADAYLVRK